MLRLIHLFSKYISIYIQGLMKNSIMSTQNFKKVTKASEIINSHYIFNISILLYMWSTWKVICQITWSYTFKYVFIHSNYIEGKF